MLRTNQLCAFFLALATLGIPSIAVAEGLLPPHSRVTISLENDSFRFDEAIGETDFYYSNGFEAKLDYPSRRAVKEWLPVHEDDDFLIEHAIGHQIYTPIDLFNPTADPSDHPYSALLNYTFGISHVTDAAVTRGAVRVGLIGESALGDELQNATHDAFGGIDANGWDAQLDDEPTLDIALDHERIFAFDVDSIGTLALRPAIGGTLGTALTEARLGVGASLTRSFGERVTFELFGGGLGRLVAHDITLDGNVFQDSASVDREAQVLEVHGGAAISFGRVRLAYTHTRQTERFSAQPESHAFGKFELSFDF